jgi:hypothetical protein
MLVMIPHAVPSKMSQGYHRFRPVELVSSSRWLHLVPLECHQHQGLIFEEESACLKVKWSYVPLNFCSCCNVTSWWIPFGLPLSSSRNSTNHRDRLCVSLMMMGIEPLLRKQGYPTSNLDGSGGFVEFIFVGCLFDDCYK